MDRDAWGTGGRCGDEEGDEREGDGTDARHRREGTRGLMIGRLTEQQLRDLWARWTEHRPEELDWSVDMELRMERGALRGLVGAEHTLIIRLMEGSFTGPRLLAQWETGLEFLPRFYEALLAAFEDEHLMFTCKQRVVPWYGQLVHEFVWGYVLERGA